MITARKFTDEFPISTEASFFMPGLRSTLLPLFLTVLATVLQNSLFADPAPLSLSSVKLRVDTPNGRDWGTGTIIDTRDGKALILTCGHIFRQSQGRGNIEVHLYSENSTALVPGKCLFHDEEIDLALVYITLPPSYSARAVPIAPASYRLQPLQHVWSVGCDGGGNPTVRAHQVMSIDKVSTPRTNGVPFHYVQVSGAPVGGRSGGGLFSSEGYLIGVCNTADPIVNDGHFVPPHIIRHILDRMNLAHVYQNPSLGVAAQAPTQTPPLAALTPLTPVVPVASVATPAPMAAANMPMYADNMYAKNMTGMSREEQATLEEVKRRKQEGDEMILIVRSRRNPEMPSDVIILNGASEQFLDALVKDSPRVASGHSTSNPTYNPVIFSSHDSGQPAMQPVSLPVRY